LLVSATQTLFASGETATADGLHRLLSPLPYVPNWVLKLHAVDAASGRVQTEMRLSPESATQAVSPSDERVTLVGDLNVPPPVSLPTPKVVWFVHAPAAQPPFVQIGALLGQTTQAAPPVPQAPFAVPFLQIPPSQHPFGQLSGVQSPTGRLHR
jgi:hypothetical protein